MFTLEPLLRRLVALLFGLLEEPTRLSPDDGGLHDLLDVLHRRLGGIVEARDGHVLPGVLLLDDLQDEVLGHDAGGVLRVVLVPEDGALDALSLIHI